MKYELEYEISRILVDIYVLQTPSKSLVLTMRGFYFFKSEAFQSQLGMEGNIYGRKFFYQYVVDPSTLANEFGIKILNIFLL